ncbi:hypothetical protein E6H32_04570 [Candidatus Bathyarchaeota archaeon]|nr:MAG: hypothetical protein E6H32_04570 [Candidatus Bathyarchaeota archaeon]
MTEIRVGSKRPFRTGLLTGILAIVVVLGIQLVFLRELSVFNTTLGLWVLAPVTVAKKRLPAINRGHTIHYHPDQWYFDLGRCSPC